MDNNSNLVSFKIQTPAYNALSTVQRTVKSNELNNTPPVYALTQVRTINIIEDNYNIFTEEQKKNAKLLVSLTGNDKITENIPPQQSGIYTLVFDDFTSIYFVTGFNSNYGFGIYKYTGICNNLREYDLAKINWYSAASGDRDNDNWEIFLK